MFKQLVLFVVFITNMVLAEIDYWVPIGFSEDQSTVYIHMPFESISDSTALTWVILGFDRTKWLVQCYFPDHLYNFVAYNGVVMTQKWRYPLPGTSMLRVYDVMYATAKEKNIW